MQFSKERTEGRSLSLQHQRAEGRGAPARRSSRIRPTISSGRFRLWRREGHAQPEQRARLLCSWSHACRQHEQGRRWQHSSAPLPWIRRTSPTARNSIARESLAGGDRCLQGHPRRGEDLRCRDDDRERGHLIGVLERVRRHLEHRHVPATDLWSPCSASCACIRLPDGTASDMGARCL